MSVLSLSGSPRIIRYSAVSFIIHTMLGSIGMNPALHESCYKAGLTLAQNLL